MKLKSLFPCFLPLNLVSSSIKIGGLIVCWLLCVRTFKGSWLEWKKQHKFFLILIRRTQLFFRTSGKHWCTQQESPLSKDEESLCLRNSSIESWQPMLSGPNSKSSNSSNLNPRLAFFSERFTVENWQHITVEGTLRDLRARYSDYFFVIKDNYYLKKIVV